jgi:hypothetical protein
VVELDSSHLGLQFTKKLSSMCSRDIKATTTKARSTTARATPRPIPRLLFLLVFYKTFALSIVPKVARRGSADRSHHSHRGAYSLRSNRRCQLKAELFYCNTMSRSQRYSTLFHQHTVSLMNRYLPLHRSVMANEPVGQSNTLPEILQSLNHGLLVLYGRAMADGPPVSGW